MNSPTREELDAAFCWEADDQIASRPAMTAFRRQARLHQARWREANRHPIGTQPINPKPGDTRVSLWPIVQFIGGSPTHHERNKSEVPRTENLARYAEVAERSAVFADGAIDKLMKPGDQCVMWIEHLLLFSMLQHPSDKWTWGRYAVVHPAGNPDVVDACARYRAMLANDSTFTTLTIEQLLDSEALPRPTVAALRGRYVP